MPNSLRNKIKHFCYKGYLSESERDRLLNALDDADRINSELNRVKTELDCISRDEAIKEFQVYREYSSNMSNVDWVDRIETVLIQLPSVTPKVESEDTE